MRKIRLLLPLTTLAFCLAGCLDFAETSGISIGFGSPEGDDGYSLEYKTSPADVWEAFRLVARNNGEITRENPEKMELEAKRINRSEGERTPDFMRGRVFTVAGKSPVARLIVHVREPGVADGAGLPETARSYCFAVMRVLEANKGGKLEKDKSLVTGTEPAVKEDEAVGYFKVTRAQALEALKKVIAENGELTGIDENAGVLNGLRKSSLEPVGDAVTAYLYDRTEQNNVRTKVSVRVRTKQDDKPRQETAKAYIKAVRETLEKMVGSPVEN